MQHESTEPTVTIAVPISILDEGHVELGLSEQYPESPEFYYRPGAKGALQFLADCRQALISEGAIVATGEFWPAITQGTEPFRLPTNPTS